MTDQERALKQLDQLERWALRRDAPLSMLATIMALRRFVEGL